MLVIILSFALIAIVGFLVSLINLPREYRGLQFPMVPVALVYGLTLAFFSDTIGAFLSQKASEHDLGWLSQALLLNLAVLIGFALVKVVFLPLCLTVAPSILGDRDAFLFYYNERDYTLWLLPPQHARIGIYTRGFLIAALPVAGVLVGLATAWPTALVFAFGVSPAFAIILLDALAGYTDGLTRTGFEWTLTGDDEEDVEHRRLQVNYMALRPLYNSLFGDRILHDDTIINNNWEAKVGDILTRLWQNGDDGQRAVVHYFQLQLGRGVNVDANFVQSTLDLLQGKSQLICNPFYRDLTSYIMLPMVDALARYGTCLVITGRDSTSDDVAAWVADGLTKFTGIENLWHSRILDDDEAAPCDVGVLRFRDLHNLRLLEKHDAFLRQVSLVILVEPSRIMATGQLGLGLLQDRLCDHPVAYLGVDRNCDGLVDALSHALRTSITEVFASDTPQGVISRMFWDANGPYPHDFLHPEILPDISRYLGVGSEIFAVARRFGVDNFTWLASERFPVRDIVWVLGQYYNEICDYTRLPHSQEALGRAFGVSSNLWDYPVREEAFLAVEDEFSNLFEMCRLYAPRATDQGFVHVISDDYLLRDFMVAHPALFASDPKAIPAIVADYARNERNTVLRLLLKMFHGEVGEDEVRDALTLAGVEVSQPPYETLRDLIAKHCAIDDIDLTLSFRHLPVEGGIDAVTKQAYSIDQTSNIAAYAHRLANAYFIAEGEQGERDFLGSKLYGHVYQTVLPGQFITYDGKYYEVATITPTNGVVLRRAADHITGRHSYRQLRSVDLNGFAVEDTMGASRSLDGMTIERGFADITVSTSGYLDLARYDDLAHATHIELAGIPVREYRNKAVLRIGLPEASDEVRHTIALLLNEIFVTTFPDVQPYITAIAATSDEAAPDEAIPDEPVQPGEEDTGEEDASEEDAADNTAQPNTGLLQPLLTGDALAPDSIYVIEDSEVDLGLLVAVERNLPRFFGIIVEYLKWYQQRYHQAPAAPSDEPAIPAPDLPGAPPENTSPEPTAEGTSQPASPLEPATPQVEVVAAPPEATAVASNQPGVSLASIWPQAATEAVAPPDVPPENASPEPTAESIGTPITPPSITQPELVADGPVESSSFTGENESLLNADNGYLSFGSGNTLAGLDLPETVAYLSSYGYDHNPLQQALGEDTSYQPEGRDPSGHYCDFCGRPLGTEYDVLKDGRERCQHCSATAIRKMPEFRQIFWEVVRGMQGLYGIKFTHALRIEMRDAKKVNYDQGFHPTSHSDGRILGYAQKNWRGMKLVVENGAPRACMLETLAHELTHIWQYENWPDAWASSLGPDENQQIYEGMATWSGIQFLYYMGELEEARRQEANRGGQDENGQYWDMTEYGIGFRRFRERYGIQRGGRLAIDTPFRHIPRRGVGGIWLDTPLAPPPDASPAE